MDTAIIVALIGFFATVIAAAITYASTTKAYANKLEIQIAVIEEKISTLTKVMDEHNEINKKIPVIENDIKTLYRRVSKLEGEK